MDSLESRCQVLVLLREVSFDFVTYDQVADGKIGDSI